MPITLFEVICISPSGDRRAYGTTFTDKATASAYATAMAGRGYQVDPYPAFDTLDSAETAARVALEFFEGESI